MDLIKVLSARIMIRPHKLAGVIGFGLPEVSMKLTSIFILSHTNRALEKDRHVL